VPAHRLELTLFLLYVALGPLAWLFYGLAIHAGRRRMLLMKRPPHPIEGPPPSVTILIPAKDEGERIRGCVESALAQDYPSFDVVAINDRSTDNTGSVMDEMAAAHPRLRVLHVKEPPGPGWTGKNNALHQGSRVAGGDWLLLVDSDVVLQPDALGTAMSVVLRKNFDLLSLLPRLESHTLWESLLVPLCAGAASSLYLIALNNNAQVNRVAFANGQFMLMSRRAYDAIGGHVAVKDRYCEDVAIAELMKKQGLRPRVSWGSEYASVRMYSSLPAIFRGWSRIYYAAQAGRPWRILIGMTFLLLCGFSVIPALAWGAWRLPHPGPTLGLFDTTGAAWLAAGAAHLLFMTWFLATIYRWSGNPRRNALLFLPLGGPMLLATFFKGLKMCVTKKVEWRGTAYSHTMAPELGRGHLG
jgi:cellulose synthase/poly-beta-1,6-N-acetylglucosamine synthase-like glycosyltransferase